MKTKINSITEIEFGNVYMSELNATVSIYKKTILKASCKTNLLQDILLPSHFGLPLAVAIHANQVIGFASANFNPTGEVEMNCYFSEGFEGAEIEHGLKEKAYKNLNRTFDGDEESIAQLKTSIERLVYWLNR
jgi:hypothetical protein